MEDIKYSLDSPSSETSYLLDRIPVSGWIYCSKKNQGILSVRAFCNGIVVGETSNFYERFDVLAALSLRKNLKLGFHMLAGISDLNITKNNAKLTFSVRFENDDKYYDFCTKTIKFHTVDITNRHYGQLIRPDMVKIFHRENIYGSGPSSPIADNKCVDLILQYLDASDSVLDVGCGIGAYGERLIAKGFEWMGVEAKESDCAVLEKKKLPHMRIETDKRFPFQNERFGNAICIEVLEHVGEVHLFLSEIARIVRKKALFSVPNIEIIPMLQPYGVVPWHLLEATHVNFFTRYNLKNVLEKHFRHVEVIDYGALPIRSIEGCELMQHLFAIANK